MSSEWTSEECGHCGSADTEWQCTTRNNSQVVDGRLRMNDISVQFFLGCNECSETLEVLDASTFMDRISATSLDKPADAGVAVPLAKLQSIGDCLRIDALRLDSSRLASVCIEGHDAIVNLIAEIRGAELSIITKPADSGVTMTKEDAGNYGCIVSLLEMEEEGDPVAEVKKLIAARHARQCDVVACIDHRHLQLLRKNWTQWNCLKHPDDADPGDVLLYTGPTMAQPEQTNARQGGVVDQAEVCDLPRGWRAALDFGICTLDTEIDIRETPDDPGNRKMKRNKTVLQKLLVSLKAQPKQAKAAGSKAVEPTPLPMLCAPRCGEMLRLLVKFTEHPIEDEKESWTIGSNSFDADGVDEWQFAGWCWSHDHFTEGKGTPIGWLPFHQSQPEQVKASGERA